MAKKKTVEFPDAGVTVTVPAQKKKVKVLEKPIKNPEKIKKAKGKFKARRLVMNLVLVDRDDPKKTLTKFDPPIEVRVRYRKKDLENAEKAGKKLALAFWNGKVWVIFSKKKHKFQLQPDEKPKKGGYGVVEISNWGDPPIGWGDR
jgi:hypothetical protein